MSTALRTTWPKALQHIQECSYPGPVLSGDYQFISLPQIWPHRDHAREAAEECSKPGTMRIFITDFGRSFMIRAWKPWHQRTSS